MKLTKNFGAFALPCLALAVVACDDEDPEFGPPAVSFSPEGPDFGTVPVTEVSTLEVVIRNDGGRAWSWDQTIIDNEANFEIADGPTLPFSLAPTATVAFSIRYTPCAAALADPSQAESCTFGVQSGNITFIDNIDDAGSGASAGPTVLTVIGTPANPPNPRFRCSAVQGRGDPSDVEGCGVASNNFSGCNQINFGAIQSDACDMYVEVINEPASDQSGAVAPLEVFDFDFVLFELNGDASTAVDAEELGFEILAVDREDENGNLVPLAAPERLVAGSTNPWRVPGGTSLESRSFIVRLTPSSDGIFTGTGSQDQGLILNTNEPEDPVRSISLAAAVQVPEISCIVNNTVVPNGGSSRFRNVAIGETETANLSCLNSGSGTLTINNVTVDPDDDEFSVMGASATPATNRIDMVVAYSPTDGEPDEITVIIESDSPANARYEVNFLGGDTPQIACRPTGIFFQSSGGTRTCDTFDCANEGDASLEITGVTIRAVEGSEGSADDFSIGEGTDALPATVAPGSSWEGEVCYENGDSSRFDTADVVVASNDPANPEEQVTLTAEDEVCFGPSIQIDEIPDGPSTCVDGATTLSMADSIGGGVGGTATVESCTLRTVSGVRLEFTPNPTTSDVDLETVFVPPSRPLSLIEVTCTNSCGAEGSGRIPITIAADCN